MPRFLQRILGMIAGAILGLLALFLFYYLLIAIMIAFDMSYARFRLPAILFLLPVFGAWGGFRFAPKIFAAGKCSALPTCGSISDSWIGRLALVGPAVWLLSVLGFVVLFEPYG